MVHFKRGRRSRKQIRFGEESTPVPGRVPRVSKLMALAIRFEQLVSDGDTQHAARSPHFLADLDGFARIEHHDADVVGVQIKCPAQSISRET